MAASLGLTAVSGLNCNKRAGVKELYIAPTSDLASIVAGTTSHDVTDVVFETAGAGFGKLGFKRGECEITESMETSNEVTIAFAVPNPNADQRFQLEKIRKNCEMYAVARLYDDERLLFIGYDAITEDEGFVKFNNLESTSGKATSDANLFVMNLMAEQGEMLRVLSGLSGVSATTTTAIIAELVAATNV